MIPRFLPFFSERERSCFFISFYPLLSILVFPSFEVTWIHEFPLLLATEVGKRPAGNDILIPAFASFGCPSIETSSLSLDAWLTSSSPLMWLTLRWSRGRHKRKGQEDWEHRSWLLIWFMTRGKDNKRSRRRMKTVRKTRDNRHEWMSDEDKELVWHPPLFSLQGILTLTPD